MLVTDIFYSFHSHIHAHTHLPAVPPEFDVKPTDVVATRGDSVTFLCGTISSPSFTIIHWLHGGQLLDSGERYNISTEGRRGEDGTAMTAGVLTIDDVDGLDSGLLECRATYSNADNSETTSISSDAALGVLGEGWT